MNLFYNSNIMKYLKHKKLWKSYLFQKSFLPELKQLKQRKGKINKRFITGPSFILIQTEKTDKILIVIGFTCAIITDLGLPSFVFLFGDIVNSFGKEGLRF